MNNVLIFISFSVFTSLVSFLLDRQKTILGFKKGLKMFKNIFIYLGAFSTLKIPMLGIEIGYLG